MDGFISVPAEYGWTPSPTETWEGLRAEPLFPDVPKYTLKSLSRPPQKFEQTRNHKVVNNDMVSQANGKLKV